MILKRLIIDGIIWFLSYLAAVTVMLLALIAMTIVCHFLHIEDAREIAEDTIRSRLDNGKAKTTK